MDINIDKANQEKKRNKRGCLAVFKSKKTKPNYKTSKEFLNRRKHIKLLPLSVYPKKQINKYLGIIDIHLIRKVYKIQTEEKVDQIIEGVIGEICEMVTSRVEALGGNCLLGYKIDINTLEQTQS